MFFHPRNVICMNASECEVILFMRKLLLMLLLLMLPAAALAAPEWTEAPDLIRPGKSIRMTCKADAPADVLLLEKDGSEVAVIGQDLQPRDGEIRLYWDGTDESGESIPEGQYTLLMRCGEESAREKVKVGPQAPEILGVMADDTCSGEWYAWVETSTAGRLTVELHTADGDITLIDQSCEEGENELTWDGHIKYKPLANGDWEITLRLWDDTDFSSNPETMTLTMDWPELATDLEYHTPSDVSSIQCDHDPCYWNLNMGEMDEAAIWDVLTQPVTVLKGEQRQMIKIRKEPSKDCTEYVGEVTCDSQAVHILDQQGDWTLIEAYSSSTSGSRVKVWALRFEGWVETSLLEEREVDQEYGIVIDKLQQRMYIFKDGHLFTTLMISTGFPTRTDPFNETPAGEFLIVSWTGGFWSEEIYCDYALRINGGILLHEVPCYPIWSESDPTKMVDKDFANFEGYLGEKASHGCIRIQRRKTPENVNAKWLWDNLNRKKDTKVIIWDELGRTLGYAEDDVLLYYNPKGGRYYHSSPICAEVNQKYWPLASFTYGELEEDEFDSLKRCKACAPQLRISEVDQLNEENHR